MSHSVKDSDDDFEPRSATGRLQTRMLTVHSANSPLRRSSRLKQNKYSPSSESDNGSISSTQTTQSTRTRTATIDSTISDTMKKLYTRKHSISSEISEIDIDILQTPGKRTTRQSSGAANLIGTPVKVNTRATSKRFMRAGSETKSPLSTRTRKTRASSVDPESLIENKSQSSSPIKTRRRASMLPSGSQIKEQIELNDRIPYIQLNSTIVEADEITNSGNSDSSPDKALQHLHQINRKLQSIIKDKDEEDYSHKKVETSIDSSESEILQLSQKKDETQTEDIHRETVKNTENILDKEQNKFEKTPPSDKGTIEEFSTYSSPNHRNSTKEDTKKIVESFSNIEKSLLDICESTKTIEVISENLSDTSIEEQKSNKENQKLNSISDIAEKSMQPEMTSSSIKSLALPFMNKLLSEKETKFMKNELNLNKKHRSRESTEIAIKHSDLLKETTDNSQEKMDISIESINSSATDKTILLHDNIEVVDKVTNKDEISIENTSTSSYNEDVTEVISELDKTENKKERTVTDNENSNKIKSNEVDKTSINLVTSMQINYSRESLASILTIDDNNEIKLVLEEQSPHRNENKDSSNITHSNSDQSINLQISSSINKTSTDSATEIDKQSHTVQDKVIVIDSSDSTEQEQENLLKHETESTFQSSNTVLETNNSTRDDSNDAIIQDNQFTDAIEASNKSTMDISLEKTDSKDILSEKVKQNLERKNIDNLEKEKEMETIQKDRENMDIADDVSDINAGINLFQDIPADKWKEKNDVKTSSVQSTSQLIKEVENENEVECDLILMDRQAWLAAETIKAAKKAEPFEYDSDDTILLKSRLDASQANYDIDKLATTDEELPMDIDNEENEKQIKKRKSRTKKRLVSEIDEDISRYIENEDNLIPVDKSLSESKTALNRTNDRSIFRLNKSEQLTKTKRSTEASNESAKEIENDANELNRSSLINKNNISLRKSIGERTSLNKSSKNISVENISPNKSQIDNSEKELDDTVTNIRKKLYKKKRSLNKSCNENVDDNTIESEKKNISTEDCNKKHGNASLNHSMDQESKPIDIRKTILLNDESDNSDMGVSIIAMDLGSKTYSMIANAGSESDQDECKIPSYLFTKANSKSNTDDSSGYSDINREYNLDGISPKFSDDVAADECRTSEVEFSDSDDNGSDLEDFIVDDTEAENEEDDEENNEKDAKTIQREKVEDKEKKVHNDTELINMENENKDENVQEKDTADEDTNKNKFIEMKAISLYADTSYKLPKIYECKNKSIERISPRKSETETKQDIKLKKSRIKKNKIILLESSNSDLSIKKKKKKFLMKENETILSDTSNSISSSLKKKKILDPQYSRDGVEQNSSEQLNEFKSTFAKLSKSRMLMEFSTPNFNSSKKLELDETFERTPKNKDNKSNNTTKATQNISIKKNKSKKDLTLNRDNSFNDASKKKMSSSDFSPDLLTMLEKTSLLKSSKIKRKTMNIEIETPRIKYLRKEKLNESAPILEYTENNSLQKQLSAEKDTTQIKIKKKNKDKISDLITLSSDDVIQKCSQKKQKKPNIESSNKNMIKEVLSEDKIELNVPKKKKVKLTELSVVEDNTRKDTYQINEKKKKKNISNENITDRTVSKDAIELKTSKKKKPVKLTQLPIAENNTREDVCQINEREMKKQDMLRKYIIREMLSKDIIKLKSPKKKKCDKIIQLPIVEDNIREVCQINERKKKKQDVAKKNIIDKSLSEDIIEIKLPKKKKHAKLTQLSIIEDNTREACQINKNEKKKKQINIIEESTNINKDDMLRKNIRGNRKELPQHKKETKIVNNLKLNLLTDKQEQQIKKKIKQQETEERIETLRTEKKKKNTLPVQIPVSKLKSEKILLSNKLRLQKTALGMSESKNVACTKKLDEVVCDAKMCIEESRSKKKRNRSEDIENASYIPTKKLKKEIKEESKFLPSSSLKRLPDDVIENLVDVPTKAKKKQKTSQNKKKIISSVITGKSKTSTADRNSTLNTSDYTTQFQVVNLQDTKKQSSKGAAAAASFRQLMLARNNREPISTYMMFCEKMTHAK